MLQPHFPQFPRVWHRQWATRTTSPRNQLSWGSSAGRVLFAVCLAGIRAAVGYRWPLAGLTYYFWPVRGRIFSGSL